MEDQETEQTTRPGDEPVNVLEVGIDPETKEVCVNVPVCPQVDGFWHVTFSAAQARNFAGLLMKKANELEAL